MVQFPIVAKFNPEAAAPDTDFRDKNAVDRFLECGKFRRCANLKAVRANLRDAAVYMPTCMKSRFNRTGFAADIEMPAPGRPLGPVTYSSLGFWAPLISCPRNCREYEHPALAKLKATLRPSLAWLAKLVMPRPRIPTPIIHRGPMHFHTINVDRGVVGVINTGNVKKMEVALNDIKNQNPELEQKLKEFTEAVLREASLSVEAKNDIVEQLSVLTAHMAMPQKSRVSTVIKALVTSIAANLASTGLIEHWQAIKHMLGF